MMTLAFSLNRQTIIRTDRNRLVSGSRNYIYAKFKDVSGDWQPPITAIFSNYSTILDDEFTCVVPWEAIDQPGELVVSAFCGDLHTANEIVIPIENGGYTEGSAPSPPPTDIYNQITEMVQEAIDVANSVREDADAGEFDGEQGPKGDKGDKGDTGEQGPQGIQGEKGDAGEQGPQGIQGEKGDTGEQGPQGIQGEKGDKGDKGDQGPKGEDAPQINDFQITFENPWSSQRIVDTLCPAFEETGNPVVCYPVANYPLGVKASWQPRQEGTGDPSPENVRPIVGLDEVSVHRSGANILPLNLSNELIGEVDVGLSEGIVHISGTIHGGNLYFTKQLELPVGTYTGFVYDTNAYSYSSGTVLWVYGDGIEALVDLTSESRSFIVNVTGRARIVDVYLHCDREPSGLEIDAYIGVSIMVGNQGSASFSPYIGTTATLDLPSTVYGGEVDAVTGDGVGTWAYLVFDGTEGWRVYNNSINNGLQYSLYCSVNLPDIQQGDNRVCTHFSTSNFAYWNQMTDNNFATNKQHIIVQSPIPTLDEWKSYLAAQYSAGTPVTIAYKLATPEPFQATGAQSILALSVVNTVYTDADSVKVTGRADPVTIINSLQSRLAALESAQTNL